MPLLTEEQFDRLTRIAPEMTAVQLWNVADTFERRIVALPEGEPRKPAGFRIE